MMSVTLIMDKIISIVMVVVHKVQALRIVDQHLTTAWVWRMGKTHW